MFKMSVNVCVDIFQTAGHFVTKLGMVMQHYEPQPYAEKTIVCYLQGPSPGRAHMIKI